MLEIVALYFLCKNMGERLRARGWKRPIIFQVLVVVAWFGCMFIGSLGYGVYRVIKEGPGAADNLGFAVYPIAFLSGAAGVGVLFGIVALLPNRTQPPVLPIQNA